MNCSPKAWMLIPMCGKHFNNVGIALGLGKERGWENFQPRPGSIGLFDCDDGARLSQCLPQHLGISIIARRVLWQDWNALREVLS
jgi:hypothetical protein